GDLRVPDPAGGGVDHGAPAGLREEPGRGGSGRRRTGERTGCRIDRKPSELSLAMYFEMLAVFVGDALQRYQFTAVHDRGDVGILAIDHDADQLHRDAQLRVDLVSHPRGDSLLI